MHTMHVVRHFLLPVLSTFILLTVLYYSVWPPVYPLWMAPIAFVIIAGVVIWYIRRLRRTRPDKLDAADGLNYVVIEDQFA